MSRRTLARRAEVHGTGLHTGLTVTARCLPAEPEPVFYFVAWTFRGRPRFWPD